MVQPSHHRPVAVGLLIMARRNELVAVLNLLGLLGITGDQVPALATKTLVPSLLVQLEAFAADRAHDRCLELSLKPAVELTPEDEQRKRAERNLRRRAAPCRAGLQRSHDQYRSMAPCRHPHRGEGKTDGRQPGVAEDRRHRGAIPSDGPGHAAP